MLRYSDFSPRHGPALRHAYFTAHQPRRLDRLYHQPAHAILLCQRFTHIGGAGISTCSPSPTTLVLGLGPDLPWADEPSPGNLGLSTCKFLACISLLIPAFSLLYTPRLLPVPLRRVHDAPLPIRCMNTDITCVLAPRSIWRISSSSSGRNSQRSPSFFLPHMIPVFIHLIPKLR